MDSLSSRVPRRRPKPPPDRTGGVTSSTHRSPLPRMPFRDVADRLFTRQWQVHQDGSDGEHHTGECELETGRHRQGRPS